VTSLNVAYSRDVKTILYLHPLTRQQNPDISVELTEIIHVIAKLVRSTNAGVASVECYHVTQWSTGQCSASITDHRQT